MAAPKYLERDVTTGKVTEVVTTETGPTPEVVVSTTPGGTIDPSLLPASGASTADEHITANLNQDGFGNVGVNVENSITGTVGISGVVTVTPVTSPPTAWPIADFAEGAPNTAVQPSEAIQVAGWDGTNLRVLNTDATGQLNVLDQDQLFTTYYPQPYNWPSGSTSTPAIDAFNNIMVRGPVFTDEGSMRDCFIGSSLTTALTGTCAFQNGSADVVGTATAFLTEVNDQRFIKISSDSETDYNLVLAVLDDTHLQLTVPYTGSTNPAATAVTSNWRTQTAVGGSITVSSSNVNIASGVGNNAHCAIESGLADALPILAEFNLSVSQAIANQLTVFGFQDDPDAPKAQVIVQFSGTNTNEGRFITSYANASEDTDSTPFTLPAVGSFLGEHKYRIGISSLHAMLSIDDVVVATNTLHLPAPYVTMTPVAYIQNVGIPAGSTTLSIDYIYVGDYDRIGIENQFDDNLTVSISGPFGTNNISATVTPYNNLRVTQEATQLFYDTFDTTLDTTDRWNATSGGGGSSPSTGGLDAGAVTFVCGATVNGYSLLQSQPPFPLTVPGYLKSLWSISLDFPVTTNDYRFWGLANTLATPNLTTPVVDAVGFEIGIDGKLYTVCYAGTAGTSTTRNLIADLSSSGSNKQPTDTAAHLYYTWFRGNAAFWAIDTEENIVASIATGALGPNNNTMHLTAISISNGTSGALTVNSVSLGDTGHNAMQINDGQWPWRKVTILQPSVAADADDMPMAVALHPSSPLPAGSNVIGKVDIDSGQTISVTQGTSPWAVSGIVTTSPPVNASTNLTQIGGTAVGISNPLYVKVTDGTNTMPTGDSSARSIHTTMDNSSVTVTGTVTADQGTSPWVVSLASTTVTNTVGTNLTQVANANLGATAIVNYGSTPAAAAVPAVNAYVTNTVGVTGTVTANAGTGTFTTQDAADMTGTTPGTAPANTMIVGGKYNSVAPSPLTGQTLPFQMDASGNLRVVATGGQGTASNFNSTFPSVGTAIGAMYTTSPPTYASGDMVALQTDVNGLLKVAVTSVGGTFTAAANGIIGNPVPSYADYIGFENISGNMIGVSASNPLPITGSISASNPSVGTNGSAFPSSSTQIGFESGLNLVAVSSTNPLPIVQASIGTSGATPPASINYVGGTDGTHLYGLPLSSGGGTSYVSISSPNAAAAGIFAGLQVGTPSRLSVATPLDTIVADSFDGVALDSNLWSTTLAGSGSITVSNSIASFGVSTTASNAAAIFTPFTLPEFMNPWTAAFAITMDTTLGENHRFFGVGTVPISWAATTPLQDALGFEVDTSGNLNAVVYNNGVKTASQAISTSPINYKDGNQHHYVVSWVEGYAFFFLDAYEIPTASIIGYAPSTNILPVRIHVINPTSPLGYSPILNVYGLGVGNNEAFSINVQDGKYAHRLGTVKPASTAADATDTALVVAISPNNTVGVTQSTSPWVTKGSLTHNNAAPAANNVGVLPAVASTGAPTYTDGDQVLLSADLSGNLRTSILNNPILGGGSSTIGKVDVLGNAGATMDVAQGGGTAATNALQVAGVFTSPLPTLTTGQGGAIQLDAKGQILTDLNYVAGSAVSTAATGIIKVGVTGNAGAAFDAAIGGSQPANVLQVGGQVTTGNPTYSTATQNTFSFTTTGGVRTDITSVASTALTAVPSTFGSNPTGSVIGANASIFAGTVSVPSGTFGTSPTAVAGTLPVNASLFIGTTAITTTGTAGQPLVGIAGHAGVTLDAVLGATKPANVLQVGGNDGTNAYAIPLASGGTSVVVSGSVTATCSGTSTVTPAGSTVWEVSPTTAANTKTNPFFFIPTDATNQMGTMTNWGTAPSGFSLPVNAELFVGANVVSATAPVPVSATAAANAKTNPIFVEVSDGTNQSALTATGTAPATTTFSLPVAAVLYAGATPTAIGTPATFGTAPTGTALSVNASIMSGTTALGAPNTFGTTAPTGNALGVNASLFVGTTLATAAAFGTTNSGTGVLANASIFAGTAALAAVNTNCLKTDMSSQAGTAITTVPVAFGSGTPSGNAPGVNAALFVGTTAVSATAPVPVSATAGANTKTNPLFTAITDGTNVITAAISAFGTAPTGTEVQGVNAELFVGTNAVSATAPVPVSATAAANSKTNEIFVNITDHTNSLTAAISAWGTAPTGTEVMGVNSNLFIGGTIASAAASGIQKVGISGATGVTLDAVQNATAPANVLSVGGVYNSVAPTIASGSLTALQTDVNGQLKVVGSFAAGALPDVSGALAALGALNAVATIAAAGYDSVGMFLAAGTLIGTITPQASFDGGTTWVNTFFDEAGTSNKVSSITFISANTYTARTIVGVGGASHYQVIVSAYTSGTANCTLITTTIKDPTVLFGGSTGSTTQPPTVAQMGGWTTTAAPAYTNATLNPVSLTTGGALRTQDTANGTEGSTAPSIATLIGGVNGNVLQAIVADSTGQLVISEQGGMSVIMLAILYELRAIKAAIVALGGRAAILSDADFTVQNFSQDWDKGIV
jgi:hypothetical protein